MKAEPHFNNEGDAYDQWEGMVTQNIERIFEVSTSDAQGIVEAQEFYMNQCWTKGMLATQTAKFIGDKSRICLQKNASTIVAEPFKHDFKNSLGHIDVDGMHGFIKALNEIYSHIASETEGKPYRRYIDAAAMLERISATMDELNPLINEAKEQLNSTSNTKI